MIKSKVIAMYLPQYHETEENNEWWGKGYTDWNAVKQSKPYYCGHNQPRVPLNNNYYRLDNVETLRWQADLAKKYSVDGFCIYHYYSNGLLQMRKPAEILLENTDIKIEYFFSWANHDFRKQWFDGDGRLLRKQEYGEQEDWINHFNYLSKFFQDKRYIKIDGKPVLAIYDIFHIDCFDDMMRLWNKMAKEKGYNGIFLIATKSNTNLRSSDLLKSPWINRVFIFEPMNYRSNGFSGNRIYTSLRRIRTVFIRANNKIRKKHLIQEKFNIKRAYDAILDREMLPEELYGFFTEWDNTPRYRGKSIVFKGGSVTLFEEYLSKIYQKSCVTNKEFLFINAWNEWGESAYLEPDVVNKYKYLEAIERVKRQIRI
ncbi:glycoside hydrolase family 99-like domain-containing protein [Clostridium polynesiense]|uniref:glycosyltransferase WbsX family protein n=1 Tax=Clostridium polynesiense TaxID=1325933 RepID=UPI00058CCD35|nr:glycoside hydrolase family 99-like domain-containing protein [Clostridium polynesiense]